MCVRGRAGKLPIKVEQASYFRKRQASNYLLTWLAFPLLLKYISQPIISDEERTKAQSVVVSLLKSRMSSCRLIRDNSFEVIPLNTSSIGGPVDPNDFSAYMTPMLHPTVLGEYAAESIMSRYLEMPPPEKTKQLYNGGPQQE